MRDRTLLRPPTSGRGGVGQQQQQSQPTASSDVIGLLPEQVHRAIVVAASASSPPPHSTTAAAAAAPPPSGGIDLPSGLAYLVVPATSAAGAASANAAAVYVWPHETQTLSECLAVPERFGRFVHPESVAEESGGGGTGGGGGPPPLHGRLVALTPYGGGTGGAASAASGAAGGLASPGFASPHRSRTGSHLSRSLPLQSLYVSTPTGVLCYWSDALTDGGWLSDSGDSADGMDDRPPPPPMCDASVRLPLPPDEYVTCLETTLTSSSSNRRTSGGGGASSFGSFGAESLVLLGTSQGKVWLAYRTARPLALRARMLDGRRLAGAGAGAGAGGGEDGTGAGGGSSIFGWLLGGSSASADEGGAGAPSSPAASSSTVPSTSTSAIIDIHPLPPAPPTSSSSASSSSSSTDISESPRKSARTSTHPPTSFVTVSSDLIVSRWTLTKSSSSGGGESSGSYVEIVDWTVDLGSNLANSLTTEGGGADIAEVNGVDVLKSSTSSDGTVLTIVFLASVGDSKGPTPPLVRAYLSILNLQTRTVITPRPIWLDRHPSQLLRMGRLDCAGVVVVRDDDDFGGDGAVSTYVVHTMWHDPRPASAGNDQVSAPVTATVVRFTTSSSASSSTSITNSDRYDVDLPTPTIPSLLDGTVSIDVTTNGSSCISSNGCVTNLRIRYPVRPPRVVTSAAAAAGSVVSKEGTVDEADVQAVTSHLLSAYLQHARSTNGVGGSGGDVSSSSLPPSIHSANSKTLSAAVALASDRLLVLLASGDLGLQDANDLRSALAHTLPSFTNFLIHGGVYRRVSNLGGRLHLRNTGEKMASVLYGMDDFWRGELRRRKRLGLRASSSQTVITEFLNETNDGSPAGVVLDDELPRKLAQLQVALLGGGDSSAMMSRMSIAAASSSASTSTSTSTATTAGRVGSVETLSALLCSAHLAALRYREENSVVLFDLDVDLPPPLLGGGTASRSAAAATTKAGAGATAPWTSDPTMLAVYTRQLEAYVPSAGASSSSATSAVAHQAAAGHSNNTDRTTVGVHVQTLAHALLDGYRDLLLVRCSNDDGRDTNNAALLASYDSAKRLAVPLVRAHDPSGDGGDRAALEISLDHGYFEGVVSVCHHMTLGGGRFGEEEKDGGEGDGDGDDDGGSFFDLRRILAACSSSSSSSASDIASAAADPAAAPYATLLPPATDYRTGLTFPEYVLKWYADRSLYGHVLDLGRNCPADLGRYVERDSRMVGDRWVVNVRAGRFGDAADCLVGMVTADAAGGNDQQRRQQEQQQPKEQSVEERRLILSLGKLSGILAAPSSSNTAGSAPQLPGSGRSGLIDDNLLLLEAQEMLSSSCSPSTDIDRSDDDVQMSVPELLGLVHSGVESLASSAVGGGGDAVTATPTATAAEASEEAVRICLIGLAVAEAAGRLGQNDHAAVGAAAPVWARSVVFDIDVWEGLVADEEGGRTYTDDEWGDAVAGTVFCGLVREYGDGRRGAEADGVGVGFVDRSDVRGMVLEDLGSGGSGGALEKILMEAAKVAVAIN